MFGWLKKKGQDSRVQMCIKEVRLALEMMDSVKRAKVLAIASLLRNEFFSTGQFPKGVVDRPLEYSREDLMRVYYALEDIRNGQKIEMARIKQLVGKSGMEYPAFAEELWKMCVRGFEVWMATVGAGIVADRRDDVREIWKLLIQSKPLLDKAMNAIVATEQEIIASLGQEGEMFSNCTREEWKVACDFLPSEFSKDQGFGC